MATDTLTDVGVSPDFPEPDFLYEVVDGEIVETPWMSAHDGVVASELFRGLVLFDPEQKLGQPVVEVLFMLDREKKLRRRPDVAFVSRERWPVNRPVGRANSWDVVPDLAVEVVSPTNYSEQDMDKLGEYFEAGVRLVWFVYPKHQRIYVYDSIASVHILQEGDELDGGDVLPGFRLLLTALFGERTAGSA